MSSLAHFSGYVTRFLLIHQVVEWIFSEGTRIADS